MDAPMIQIGGSSPEAQKTFNDLATAVLAVLSAACGDTVKVKALEVLSSVHNQPLHASISSCTFTAGNPGAGHHPPGYHPPESFYRPPERHPPTTNPLSDPDAFRGDHDDDDD